MNPFRTFVVIASLALGAGGAGTALAAQHASAPAKVTVKAVGAGSFKPNRYIQDGARFDRDVYTVRAGGTVTLKDAIRKGAEGPHTLSVLKRNQVPHTLAAVNQCGEAGQNPKAKGTCAEIAQAHGPTEQGVKNPVVNKGKAGLDQAGDSIFVNPNGAPQSSRSIKVSAKKGSTLYFICLIHPWMQAKIQVK